MFDPELESFKNIDLRAYAAAQGFQLDKRDSWRGSAVMRNPADGGKIVIQRDSTSGHYVYFSVRDDRDNGTIIDFVQFRQGLSLGAVRKELRPWIGQPPVPVPVFPVLQKTAKDRMKVEAAYARMRDAGEGHLYLERERALPPALLTDRRFTGRIRTDDRGNAVFPHFDADGLSGYELKNAGFTGFASGGSKALWLSHEMSDDNKLVVSESAIDALSFAVLFPDDHTRYASIGGKTSPQQQELVRAAIARLPASSEVISAMDSDQGGAELTEAVRRAFELSGRQDLRFTVQLPPAGQKDFNDVLRARQFDLFPTARPSSPEVA